MSTIKFFSSSFLKVFAISLLMVTSVANSFAIERLSSLCINEIMQSNINTVIIEMDFPDSWVELYNPTSEGVNIYHYYIGSSPNYKENYRITEDETVCAGGYTLIYLDKEAKGKHTDFRLNSDNPGVLFLFNNTGVLIDSLYYPAMPAPNIAYARDTDDAQSWHYVNKPTPNSSNIGGGSDILLPQPYFSISGHVMTEPETLTVSIPVTDMTMPVDTRLYMTFDGSEPETSSICIARGDTTLLIGKTTVVRARLISSHALCPLSRTESFIFHSRSTDIPIISLATNDTYLYSDSLGIFSSDTIPGNTKPNYSYNWRRPLNMEYLGVAGDAPLFNQWGETGMFGQSTREAQQKSMKLIANKRFGTKHLNGVLWPAVKPDIYKQKAVCLRSCTSGGRIMEGLMQNWFGMHIPDLDYQAFSPAIVYINGVYKGFMGLREKSDEDYVWANYDKLENIEMVEFLNATKPVSFKEVKDGILSGTIDYEEAAMHIDMDNTADMIAINIICNNTDWPYKNTFFWRPADDEGKWRWIMKDMDMINVAYRCTDPVTFNYLKYLTNTGELGSQEYEFYLISDQLWPRVELLGKLIVMPEFRNLLIDRLQVFMGDFMRWDVMQKYLEAQLESLNTEVTQSLLMLEAGSKYTFPNKINRDLDFFRARPVEVYQHLADFYQLGAVIPMTTKNNGLPVSINGIPLTEGDYNGACFSNRAVRLDSGDEGTGWLVHIRYANNIIVNGGYMSPAIGIIPANYLTTAGNDIASIEFETCSFEKIAESIVAPQQNSIEIESVYSLHGLKLSGDIKSPSIIRYSDGHSEKKVKRNGIRAHF